MTTKKLFIYLAILMITLTTSLAAAIKVEANYEIQKPVGTTATSCISPQTYELRVSCRHIENQILASTVRIELSGWHLVGGQRLPLANGGTSHATITGGRYLLTHNHFRYSLTEPATQNGEGYTAISLRRMDGSLILENAPLSIFSIAARDTQILVLEFKGSNGGGLFEERGYPSAITIPWNSIPWQQGMELAHIDWDGQKAHVDWVRVEAVVTSGTEPHLQVNNYALKGASGGGAFWNGYHIGNVWAHNLEKDPITGSVTRLYTLIALNNARITALD